MAPEIQEIIENPDNVAFKPNEGPQMEFLAAPEQEVFYGGPLGLDTVVPTVDGFKTIASLKIGDKVFSENGHPTKIISKSPIFYNKTYKVIFSSGEEVVADETHLWKVKTSEDRYKSSYYNKNYESSVTTEFMFKNLKNKYGQLNFAVENAQPIQLPPVSLPIEPYLFGLWLGDGRNRDCEIGSLVADVEDYLTHIKTPVKVNLRNREKENKQNMKLIKFGKPALLKNNNLFHNKHIPVSYLRSSFEQRLNLLQGIMDTDGTCTTTGKCKLTFKSKILIEDTFKLISSLGIKTTIKNKIAKSQTGYTCLVYTVQFNTDLPVFKLQRKLNRQKISEFSTSKKRYIKDVIEIETQPTQCITVEHNSHTFLILSSCIKTHNSKGGGKTYALLIDPLRYCQYKNHRALLLRRSLTDLKDVIFKAKILYPKAFPGVRWSDNDKAFYFPSGARIEMGYCETQSDLVRYHGQNYNYIGVDEICHFPFVQEMLNYLRANIRTVDPKNTPPMFRCTGNPGEVSSDFIKKEFIDPAPHDTVFWNTVKIFDPRTKEHRKVHISKKFIKATVFDNPYLLSDDSYLATLASLPEVKRKQWLEGSWDVSENSAFPEFDANVHVVANFTIGRDWKRLKGQDWGFRQNGAVYWGAVSPQGQLVIYREFVFNNKDALKVAQEGKAMELGEPRSLGVLDASAWQQRGTLGQAIGEIMQQHWPSWTPSSRARNSATSSRTHRKNLVHTHLALDPTTGQPRMVIFPQCRKLIECLAGITVEKNDPEKVDTDSPLDHYFDAISYLLMGRPTQLRSWTDTSFMRLENNNYRINDATFGY